MTHRTQNVRGESRAGARAASAWSKSIVLADRRHQFFLIIHHLARRPLMRKAGPNRTCSKPIELVHHLMKSNSSIGCWRSAVIGFGLLAAIASRPTVAASTRSSLDLSYHHNLKAKTLAKAIEYGISCSVDNVANEGILKVDVSSSALGDEGFKELQETIFHNDGKASPSLHLVARMNELSIAGVTPLIQKVIGSDEVKDAEDASSSSTSDDNLRPTSSSSTRRLESLDLGWNHLSTGGSGGKEFLKALRLLIQSPKCPTTLRLDCCAIGPATCRAIGKGIIQRFKDKKDVKPLSLYLCGNHDIGDAGIAALAAAIREISDKNQDCLIFEHLDLSGCNIGDTGAEALALALENSPRCYIHHLILNTNGISDQGASVLGKALSAHEKSDEPPLLSLDLGNNKDIGDRGVGDIAVAFGLGKLPNVSLRSCHIHADGASSFGKALRTLAMSDADDLSFVALDLSGNPLGVLRGKSKPDGGKYSASRLKSKASATAVSYMNLFKKGLKDVGLGVGVASMSAEGESDDEVENADGEDGDQADDDESKRRCGAKAFASSFLGEDPKQRDVSSFTRRRIKVGIAMRHCFFDHGAADALAAIMVAATDEMCLDLTLDIELNPILEEEMVSALHGDVMYKGRLREMADRYMDAMEAIQESRVRAARAADMSSARFREEPEFEARWDVPDGFVDVDVKDSDADYEEDGEDYY